MCRFLLWSLALLFPLCLLVGCAKEEGAPAKNVQTVQPQKGKAAKKGEEPASGNKNATTITD